MGRVGSGTNILPNLARMERNRAHPGLWMAVLLVILALGAQIALSIPLG